MEKGSFDNRIEGQMTIEDLFTPPQSMVAVSNIFARARKEMSLSEQKAFIFALTKLKFTEDADKQSNSVIIEKKTLANILGYKSDTTDLSYNLYKEIKDLWKHSYIEIADRDRGFYDSGTFITRVSKFRDYFRIKFEPEYFPLFTGLERDYLTMWSADIFQMTSKRTVQFYELLRQMSFDQYAVGNNLYSYGWGVKAFKDMFGIPESGKGSYMREKGGFDRTNFENKVIMPLCNDLAKCKMIQLVINPDGKPYKKVYGGKSGKRVDGYQFYWTFSAHPKVATANEVKEIQDRVDKDGEVLKVAKDIIEGEKKPKKPKRKDNDFRNFEEREYNYDELLKRFAKN